MNPVTELSIESVQRSKTSFCKFISANDVGKTGGHQSGFYIPKNSIKLMFDEPGIKGFNKDRFITIKWQGDFETQSRFTYYGIGTRNEYRLTRFGRGFPYFNENCVGDLLVLCNIEGDFYEGYVLQSDNDIEDFFSAFNISSSDTNNLINKGNTVSKESKLISCLEKYVQGVGNEFPPSVEMSFTARNCYITSTNTTDSKILSNPDGTLLSWIDTEYSLFKLIENALYKGLLSTPFESVEQLVLFANSILNRRKSRAGKSLEHHLSDIFNRCSLKFQQQVITEENKKPDFIFPDILSYRNKSYNPDKLIFLASKTTCKDRWRQILNEADRIPVKHLFTLQQGISRNQLLEMYKYDVKLVVPKPYKDKFPSDFQDKILTLQEFVNRVKSIQI